MEDLVKKKQLSEDFNWLMTKKIWMQEMNTGKMGSETWVKLDPW